MSKPKVISPEEYAKARAILLAETQATISNIKFNLMPSEADGFTCIKCLRPTLARDKDTHYCLACYVPKTLFGECGKCGQPLHNENYTGKCLNQYWCK